MGNRVAVMTVTSTEMSPFSVREQNSWYWFSSQNGAANNPCHRPLWHSHRAITAINGHGSTKWLFSFLLLKLYRPFVRTRALFHRRGINCRGACCEIGLKALLSSNICIAPLTNQERGVCGKRLQTEIPVVMWLGFLV